jgi:preprotein translocase subunit SecD
MVYLDRWKVILIICVCLFGVLYAAPNVMSAQTRGWIAANMPGFVPSQSVNLGLDLRGGSYLLLEVAVDSVVDERLQSLTDDVRRKFREAKLGYTDLAVSGGALHVKLTDPSQSDKAKELLREVDNDTDISVSNGDFTVRMTADKIAERKRQAMEQSIEIVRRRIDATGTREPSIQRQGDNRIIV